MFPNRLSPHQPRTERIRKWKKKAPSLPSPSTYPQKASLKCIYEWGVILNLLLTPTYRTAVKDDDAKAAAAAANNQRFLYSAVSFVRTRSWLAGGGWMDSDRVSKESGSGLTYLLTLLTVSNNNNAWIRAFALCLAAFA